MAAVIIEEPTDQEYSRYLTHQIDGLLSPLTGTPQADTFLSEYEKVIDWYVHLVQLHGPEKGMQLVEKAEIRTQARRMGVSEAHYKRTYVQ